MKILQINAVYGSGSTGVIVHDIEQMCECNGIKCFIASPDPNVKNALRGYSIGNYFDHKLHALLSRVNGRQAYFSRFPTYRLCRYIEKIGPDIVHIHNVHSNYIHFNKLLKYLAAMNIKTVITLHDCWPYTGGCFHYTAVGCNGWLRGCGNCPQKHQGTMAYFGDYSDKILSDRKKYIMAIPRLVICGVSEWISEECKKSVLSNSRIVTIHNGIDLNVFKPTPIPERSIILKKIQSIVNGRRVILAPASKWMLQVNKTVLEYFSTHMRSDELLLVYGCRKEKLVEGENILSVGYMQSREEMAALYTLADVLVNCTREDSLSLVNIECQACGTPVVTFNATAPKETVDNINSFSVEVGDSRALYEMAEYVIRNKTSFNCREFISQRFEVHSNYHKYIELYESI